MRSLFLFSALTAVAVGVSASHSKLDKVGYRLRARATPMGLTSPDKPQQTGTAGDCNLWYDVVSGDTCDSIPAAFGITRAQFLSWNPAVSADCAQNFWVGYAYCVGVSSSPTPADPTFSGIPCTCNKYYTIVSGDTCPSIATKFGITRDQFLAWNPAVSADCSQNFWVGESYCVGVSGATTCPATSAATPTTKSTSTTKAGTTSSSSHATTANPTPTTPTFPNIACNCNKFYDVGPDDTCPSVQTRFGITADQFFQWNPDVSNNCTFNFYIGFSYCVGVAGSSSCSTVSSPPQTGATNTVPYSVITDGTFASAGPQPTSTDWPPKPVQDGIPSTCLQYYQATAVDTCVSIQHRFSHQMTIDQMLQWNPSVGADCENLFVNYYYCVSIPTAYTDLPSATTQYTFTLDPFPTTTWNLTSLSALQTTFSGAATPCAILFPAPQNSSCDDLDSMIGVPAASLSAWNTGINCANLNPSEWYCIASSTLASGSPITTPPIDNSTTTSMSSDPSTSTTVSSGSSALTTGVPSSSSTSTTGGTSNSSSTKLASATTTATPVTASQASLSTPAPTQTGMVANCNRFYKVESGDGCWAIANAANIDVNKFYSMNPAVGTDCSLLLAGFYVCLGLVSDGGPATTITSGTPVAPTITSGTPAAPTVTSGTQVAATPRPVQTGMAAGCTRFYLVESGDSCSVIASDAGISLSTFLSLNPAVGSNCSSLLAEFYVCIGSGTATTITSGKPVAAPTKR